MLNRIWFARLRRRIPRTEDAVLLEESWRSYRARAYRAAYVMTWIAVSEALKARLSEMGYRDSEIARALRQITQRESQKQSADRLILEKAADFGLVANEHVARLQHMFDMRSIFVHPYSQAPASEEVRAAMVVAVDAVLSKPAFLRHGYINQMLDLLFGHKTYLDDLEASVGAAAREVSRRVLPELHSYLFGLLIEKMAGILNDPDAAWSRRRAVWFGRSYIRATNPNLNEQEWDIINRVARFSDAAVDMLAVPEIWNLLPEQAQDILLGTLIEGTPQQFFSYDPGREISLSSLGKALQLEEATMLSERQRARLTEAIDDIPLKTLAISMAEMTGYGQRVVTFLASHDWYRQNVAIDVVKAAGADKIGRCSVELQESLGRNVLQAAEGTAGHAEAFMEELASGNKEWPQRFIKGILLECFVDDDDRIRLKSTWLRVALLGVIRGSAGGATEILEDVVERVLQGKIKRRSLPDYFSAAISAISQVAGELAGQDDSLEGHVQRIAVALTEREAELTYSY